MRSKKSLIFLLCLMLVAVLSMSACSFGFSFIRDSISNITGGKPDDPEKPDDPDDPDNPDKPDNPDPPVIPDKDYAEVVKPDAVQNTGEKFFFATAEQKSEQPYRFLTSSNYAKVNVTSDDALYSALAGNKYNGMASVKPVFASDNAAKALYEKMIQVLNNITYNEMTEYDRVLAVYDWIIYNTQYDRELYDRYLAGDKTINMNVDPQFNLTGVFINQSAVCRGISRAFVALCAIEGIAGCSVGGVNGETGHEWSKVYIHKPQFRDCTASGAAGGQVACTDETHRAWYTVDATNGNTLVYDNDKFVNETLNRTAFLVSDKNAAISGYVEDNAAYTPWATKGYPVSENDYTLSADTPEYGYYEFTKDGGVTFTANDQQSLNAIFLYAAQNRYITVEYMWTGQDAMPNGMLSAALTAAGNIQSTSYLLFLDRIYCTLIQFRADTT